MASFFSDFGIMWYLKELNKREFVKFKEFLKQEILQFGLTISCTEVKRATREGLANLLLKQYEEKQAWNITFNIFQKLNRTDLIERAKREIAGHPKLYQAHLKTKLTHDSSRVFTTIIQDLLKENFTQNDRAYFENLLPSNRTVMRPQVVVIKGMAGIGKTLILKKLMFAWSKGLLFQNNFSYIFYFCCQDVKQLKTASLAELISREWPGSSAPIEEILSEPEKLLFLIDSLEGMEWDLSECESKLCANCIEMQPVNVVLSSLLMRKILPESSLIISTTPETFEKMENRIKYTSVRTVTGLNESDIISCFYNLFQDMNRALEVFSLVRKNEQLFNICQAPIVCCMIAKCLKNEIEKGKDPISLCRHITSLYTTYIFNLFIPQNAQYPSKKSQDQMQGLCFLAAEGMWTNTFVFSEESLRRNGVMDSDIPTLLDIGMLVKIRESESSYIFLHPSVQEVCAAIFYFLKSHEDHPSQYVKCIDILIFMFLKKIKTEWIFLGCFIFGLLHELEQKKLDAFFGHQLSQEIKHQFYQCLETIRGNEELQEQIDGMKLFYCLFEMEDEAFLIQAMNCIEQINFVAKDYSDIIVAAYCLKHCSTLKKVSFSTQNILNEEQEYSSMEKLLTYWNQMCSIFISNKDIQELQIKQTCLSDPAFSVFYNHWKHRTCTIKILKVEHCNLSPDDCQNFAFVLMNSKTLKILNLACNNLDKGIYSLCKALCHPNCILENLVLDNCSLSEQCWDYLSDALRQNKILCHLDISNNELKDKGLKILCKALTLPNCVLKSLCMTHCLITSSGCQDLAEVLRNNQNLKGLQISNNKLEDAGVKLLCDAIKHPNCQLMDLGLEACEITGASSEDLSSAFLQSNTLGRVNLCGNAFEISGLALFPRF